jgi:hypothetical protein
MSSNAIGWLITLPPKRGFDRDAKQHNPVLGIKDPNAGKYLQLQFTVEDDGVFTVPWSPTMTEHGLLAGIDAVPFGLRVQNAVGRPNPMTNPVPKLARCTTRRHRPPMRRTARPLACAVVTKLLTPRTPALRLNAVVRQWRRMLDPYRPELHYMRGPGPKWRAKHARLIAH